MKKISIILLLALVVFTAKASPPLVDWVYPPSLAYQSDYTNLLANLPAANTNFIGVTNEVDQNLYHTVHVFISTNLNGCQWALDNSLDSTNWVFGTTNVWTASGNIVESNITAKKGFFRLRIVTGTNVVGTANYLGGR